ncbi:MAG: tetratricopeptide repeat protein [Thiobacillus sp.]|nr:tetratricopeptide repeat protein [Thiobacillus sp.]
MQWSIFHSRFALVLMLQWIFLLPTAQARDIKSPWLDRAQALEKQGDWPALLHLGHRWSQAEGQNPLSWFTLGRAYGELRRYPEAIEAYRQNLRVDPTDSYAYNNLGNSYHALGRHREAMAAYHDAVRAEPDYLLAWRNLGQTFYLLKGPAGVAQALRRLQASDPALAEAWRRLAATYAVTRSARVEQAAIRVLGDLAPAQRERMFAILLEGV